MRVHQVDYILVKLISLSIGFVHMKNHGLFGFNFALHLLSPVRVWSLAIFNRLLENILFLKVSCWALDSEGAQSRLQLFLVADQFKDLVWLFYKVFDFQIFEVHVGSVQCWWKDSSRFEIFRARKAQLDRMAGFCVSEWLKSWLGQLFLF